MWEVSHSGNESNFPTYRLQPVIGRCLSSFSERPTSPTQARIHAIVSNMKIANTLNGSTITVNIAVCKKENITLRNLKEWFFFRSFRT